jgi:hypothetical protein
VAEGSESFEPGLALQSFMRLVARLARWLRFVLPPCLLLSKLYPFFVFVMILSLICTQPLYFDEAD